MRETDSSSPAVSVIIPVLNEADRINDCIGHLLDSAPAFPVEVIVVDGCPDRSTIKNIENKEVQVLAGPRGRARQMNAGAALARGSGLLFLHADTRLPRGGLDLVRTTLAEVEAGAFSLGLDSRRPSIRLIAAVATIRSRLLRLPYGDQAIFIRRNLFNSLGGYRDIPLMEDVDLVRRLGWRRLRILPARAVSSARRWESEGPWRCTLRNWTLLALYGLGTPVERLARYYRF